jgi:ankyrin repeat protein
MVYTTKTACGWCGRHDLVTRLLLMHDSDIDKTAENGDSAIMLAAFHGHEPTVRLLRHAGSTVTRKKRVTDADLHVHGHHHEEMHEGREKLKEGPQSAQQVSPPLLVTTHYSRLTTCCSRYSRLTTPYSLLPTHYSLLTTRYYLILATR